ncbi:hypothetical protein [Leptospira johnsonii]|uniref:Oligopeptide-binding protein AppA n=1 Tax=Leptospira johnsonii TaxID=1917820 RepID=A0A2P2D7P4_9LEPT|nr:hypothetical protein [Leptospira johnsonii]GBF40655.1 oligopeptide-binding protein AppA [Leptospira johnsonii]
MNHLVGKTVKTKGGFDVEIIAVRPELDQPIVGIMNTEGFVNGPYELHQWHDDGTFFEYENALLDLVLE